MELRDAIEKRKDVKVYDLKAPDWRAVVRAIDAARFATSAGSHFSARFILVSDKKVIKKLTDVCQQSFVGKASYLVVAVSDPSGLIRSYGDRGEGYCAKQIGSAVQNFLLALEEEKLVTSWVWYFDDEQVKNILDIPESARVEGIFPIGREIRIKKRPHRGAVKLDNILFFEKYGEKKMKGEIKHSRDAV